MSVIRSLAACSLFAASMWTTSEARAGGCHSGHYHPVYRAPVIYYHPVHHEDDHDDDHHHHGGPGGPGAGGPGGGGPGGGGPGGGGQGGGGQGGGGQNGQNQNGQAQNGQNQNGQAQNGQAQNGQNQNGQNQNAAPAIQVPSGAQITLTGDYGVMGEVYLNVNNVKLPLVVGEWTNTGITLTLPAVKLTQAQSVTLEIVAKGGKTDSVAITLNPPPKLVVINQSQPAGQGGGGAAAGNVANAQ